MSEATDEGAPRAVWEGLGRDGHKTCKVAIRRIQYRPGCCLSTIAADATDANGCVMIVTDHDRELHKTEIKLTNLRALDVLQTQLGHGYDQAVDRLDGRIGCRELQTIRWIPLAASNPDDAPPMECQRDRDNRFATGVD